MNKLYNALANDITLWESRQNHHEPDDTALTPDVALPDGRLGRNFLKIAKQLGRQVEGLRTSTEKCNSAQRRLSSLLDKFACANAKLTEEVSALKF